MRPAERIAAGAVNQMGVKRAGRVGEREGPVVASSHR